eukprot:GHVO01026924.1.p1 GENE.GHVO01026924.1~~GHVO01026924.1.p1  ORF type:complete len:444 (+),score=128.97 GHVO01026924.1:1453-2784(+)
MDMRGGGRTQEGLDMYQSSSSNPSQPVTHTQQSRIQSFHISDLPANRQILNLTSKAVTANLTSLPKQRQTPTDKKWTLSSAHPQAPKRYTYDDPPPAPAPDVHVSLPSSVKREDREGGQGKEGRPRHVRIDTVASSSLYTNVYGPRETCRPSHSTTGSRSIHSSASAPYPDPPIASMGGGMDGGMLRSRASLCASDARGGGYFPLSDGGSRSTLMESRQTSSNTIEAAVRPSPPLPILAPLGDDEIQPRRHTTGPAALRDGSFIVSQTFPQTISPDPVHRKGGEIGGVYTSPPAYVFETGRPQGNPLISGHDNGGGSTQHVHPHMSQNMPQHMSQHMSQNISQHLSQHMSQNAPPNMSQRLGQVEAYGAGDPSDDPRPYHTGLPPPYIGVGVGGSNRSFWNNVENVKDKPKWYPVKLRGKLYAHDSASDTSSRQEKSSIGTGR